jgi:hypothetical protein
MARDTIILVRVYFIEILVRVSCSSCSRLRAALGDAVESMLLDPCGEGFGSLVLHGVRERARAGAARAWVVVAVLRVGLATETAALNTLVKEATEASTTKAVAKIGGSRSCARRRRTRCPRDNLKCSSSSLSHGVVSLSGLELLLSDDSSCGLKLELTSMLKSLNTCSKRDGVVGGGNLSSGAIANLSDLDISPLKGLAQLLHSEAVPSLGVGSILEIRHDVRVILPLNEWRGIQENQSAFL